MSSERKQPDPAPAEEPKPTRGPRGKSTTDPELIAQIECVDALDALPSPARSRVLATLAMRYGRVVTVQVGTADAPAAEPIAAFDTSEPRM